MFVDSTKSRSQTKYRCGEEILHVSVVSQTDERPDTMTPDERRAIAVCIAG
jgi:membrane-bound inhibitor of C-type lysozyme